MSDMRFEDLSLFSKYMTFSLYQVNTIKIELNSFIDSETFTKQETDCKIEEKIINILEYIWLYFLKEFKCQEIILGQMSK